MKTIKLTIIAAILALGFNAASAQVRVGFSIGTPPPRPVYVARPAYRTVVVERPAYYHRRVIVERPVHYRHSYVAYRRPVVYRHVVYRHY